MKKELVMSSILGILDPILKLIACILIGTFVHGGLWLKLIYMVGANLGVSLAGLGIKKVHATFKRGFSHNKSLSNLPNECDKQQDYNHNSVRDITDVRTLDPDSVVEIVSYSDQQIDAILKKSGMDLKNQQIPKYEIGKIALCYQILVYRTSQNMLKNQIATTINKEKLRSLKQELMKKQLELQDLLTQLQKYEEVSNVEHNEKQKKQTLK